MNNGYQLECKIYFRVFFDIMPTHMTYFILHYEILSTNNHDDNSRHDKGFIPFSLTK